MRFGSLSFFCTKAYFKGGSLLQAPFSTPPKDGGHDRVYLGVRSCELFLAPTLPAKKKREKNTPAMHLPPQKSFGKTWIMLACVAWRFWLGALSCRAGRRSGVAAEFAREARENERRSPEKNKNQAASAPISSRFLCPRPPLLLSAPNQNRHATQARIMLCSRTVLACPQSPHLFPKALENLSC